MTACVLMMREESGVHGMNPLQIILGRLLAESLPYIAVGEDPELCVSPRMARLTSR